MYKVVFSPLAIKDLEEVRLYITQELCNEQAAQKILSGIMRDIRRLSQFPESSPLLSSMVDFETDYRFLVCGNYVVFIVSLRNKCMLCVFCTGVEILCKLYSESHRNNKNADGSFDLSAFLLLCYISLRPSRARERVTSSAYSRLPPTGMP